MISIITKIGKLYDRRPWILLLVLLFLMLVVSSPVTAQHKQEQESGNTILDTIPQEAKAVFFKYVQKQDTAMAAYVSKHRRNKFIKRISFHTNLVDWLTLVPNRGVEIDLKDTPRNNYSLAIFGKFNGKSSHGKLVYNINSVRVEGRKYWRTGRYGKAKMYYDTFEKIYMDTASVYFNADTLAGYKYYVDELGRKAKAKGVKLPSLRETADMTQAERDSLDFAEDSIGIKQRKFRTWYYNVYNKVRRNYTSGRTLSNPRNWRAYYLGVWVGYDNWSISLTGKGKQGNGVGAGIAGGYTLPLYPQKFPREGSLDLEFGFAAGWKAVKYDAYTYEEHTQHYVYDPSRSCLSWKVVPYPIIQDLHVSLVWRMRGIKNKVDKSLIDDYEKKWVGKYNERKTASDNKYMRVKRQREDILDALRHRNKILTDSTDLWDNFNRRRLDAAMRINPDTVFSNEDQEMYLRIFKGLSSKDAQEKYMKHQEETVKRAAKEHAEQQKREAKEMKKRMRRAAKELADSLDNVRKDSIRAAQNATEMMDSVIKNTSAVADSVIEAPHDSISNERRTVDSLQIEAQDSVEIDVGPSSAQDSIVEMPVAVDDSITITSVSVAVMDSVAQEQFQTQKSPEVGETFSSGTETNKATYAYAFASLNCWKTDKGYKRMLYRKDDYEKKRHYL